MRVTLDNEVPLEVNITIRILALHAQTLRTNTTLEHYARTLRTDTNDYSSLLLDRVSNRISFLPRSDKSFSTTCVAHTLFSNPCTRPNLWSIPLHSPRPLSSVRQGTASIVVSTNPPCRRRNKRRGKEVFGYLCVCTCRVMVYGMCRSMACV